VPALGGCGRPPPGGVDAQAALTRSSGDAGGDVQDPVAEGADLTGGQIGMLGEADQFRRATKSVAAKMISSHAAFASERWQGTLPSPVAFS
jgi:hypothetical protein